MNTTAELLDSHYEKHDENRPRRHLGGSAIGIENGCERALWYKFRGMGQEKFSGRMLRLLETGHREEEVLINQMKEAGITILDEDIHTGKQFEVESCDGHLGGSLDGIGWGFPEVEDKNEACLIEIKTMASQPKNHKFRKLQRFGVRSTKPQHYAQMQVYMGLYENGKSGRVLNKAVYICLHKDTSEIYTEVIHFDQTEFDELMETAGRVINSSAPPPKITEDPADFKCKFCPARGACVRKEEVPRHCRTCTHATTDVNGRWLCTSDDGEHDIKGFIPMDIEMTIGCKHHSLIKELR